MKWSQPEVPSLEDLGHPDSPIPPPEINRNDPVKGSDAVTSNESTSSEDIRLKIIE